MSKTILICGYGSGISDAVARRFGAGGFRVALVARNAERLENGAAALRDAGVDAHAFPCDLGDMDAIGGMIAAVRGALGPITVLHWNAYAGVAGDLLTADIGDFRQVLDVSAVGLLAAVQASIDDLRAQGDAAAVLVTGGGFAFYNPEVDAGIVQWRAMGVAVSKAAQHKLVGLLYHRLAAEGVYVGEVVVVSPVRGTVFDSGHATLEASTVAERFWSLYQDRDVASVNVQ